MHDDIRRRALQITAKVALSLTVFGCGGTVEVASEAPVTDDPPTEPPDPDDPGEEPRDGRPERPTERPTDPALACDAVPPGEPVTALDEDRLACCVDLLEPLWADETVAGWEAWQQTKLDPDVAGCCNVVVAHVAASLEIAPAIGWSEVTQCCDAAGFPAGPACTPWGPPVPPVGLRGLTSLDLLEAMA